MFFTFTLLHSTTPTTPKEVEGYVNLRFLMGLLYCTLYVYVLVFNHVLYCITAPIMTMFGIAGTISLVSSGYEWVSWDVILYVPLFEVTKHICCVFNDLDCMPHYLSAYKLHC